MCEVELVAVTVIGELAGKGSVGPRCLAGLSDAPKKIPSKKPVSRELVSYSVFVFVLGKKFS